MYIQKSSYKDGGKNFGDALRFSSAVPSTPLAYMCSIYCAHPLLYSGLAACARVVYTRDIPLFHTSLAFRGREDAEVLEVRAKACYNPREVDARARLPRCSSSSMRANPGELYLNVYPVHFCLRAFN